MPSSGRKENGMDRHRPGRSSSVVGPVEFGDGRAARGGRESRMVDDRDVAADPGSSSPSSPTGVAPALLADGPTTLPEVGSEFLGFRLIGELGRGAFGRVYLARQAGLASRPVALK